MGFDMSAMHLDQTFNHRQPDSQPALSPCQGVKTLTMEVQRKNAERQLFGARRALGHLVELYDSGQWKTLYREDTFAEAVRQARQAVDHWTNVMAKAEDA